MLSLVALRSSRVRARPLALRISQSWPSFGEASREVAAVRRARLASSAQLRSTSDSVAVSVARHCRNCRGGRPIMRRKLGGIVSRSDSGGSQKFPDLI